MVLAHSGQRRSLRPLPKIRTDFAAKDRERLHVPIAKRFRRLGGIGHHEARVRVGQVERDEVDLAFHPANHCQGLAEVGLGLTRRNLEHRFSIPTDTQVVRFGTSESRFG